MNIFDTPQSLESELSSGPGKVIPIQCDVRNEEQILAMFERIRTELGRIDVCINNAGLAHPAYLSSGGTEHWREMLEVIHWREMLS